ncbi:MAG TPA: toll/interleukin-1 receptor domain-containing protein [Candidatus Sulfotelmatobacter sp.]|nr:toll/interleukin-1 receptor domain-containing protein [Candidatus Sulfotelmatobacter sp.]
MATVFFSYSHADEDLRDQLEIHLSGLKRQGLIESWHDRRIVVGEEFGPAIDAHMDSADVILLLVSPDFIASDYCYEREMTRALERHERGDAKVIPVILRPCDWHDLPFGKLLATPRDGLPITKWPDIDEAFLDVVTAIKHALRDRGQRAKRVSPRISESAESPSPSTEQVRSSNLRINKQFTDLDKDKFRHEGFEYIANFFENSLAELVRRNPDLQQSFRRIDRNRFTAAAYRNGEKVCRGSASLGGSTMGSESIEYSMSDEPRHGGMNEAVMVRADEQMIYFEALGMQSYGNSKDKLTFQGAAELFWEIFMRPLQSQ